MGNSKEEPLVLGGFLLSEGSKDKTESFGQETFGNIGKCVGTWTTEFLKSYREVSGTDISSEMSMEFGIKLSIKGNIVKIIKGGADADLKLHLSWKNS